MEKKKKKKKRRKGERREGREENLDRESNGVVDGVNEDLSVNNRSTSVEHSFQSRPLGGVRGHITSLEEEKEESGKENRGKRRKRKKTNGLHGALGLSVAIFGVLGQRIRNNFVVFIEINLFFLCIFFGREKKIVKKK